MGEVRAFPYERCAHVTRDAMEAQAERQRHRVGWWWLAERMAQVFAQSHPGWHWEVRSVRVEGPVAGLDGERAPYVGRGGYVQAIEGTSGPQVLVSWEPALSAALLGISGVGAHDQWPGSRWGMVEQARLDGLMVDVLAQVDARLPQDQGLRLAQSGAQLEVLLRVLGATAPLVRAHVGFGFCAPGAEPCVGYVNIWTSWGWSKTSLGRAVAGVAGQGLPRGVWGGWGFVFRLVLGAGDMTLEELGALARGDVLWVSGGARRFEASDHWGFAPCWLGWSGPHNEAWWEAALALRARGFGLILSTKGPALMSKEALTPPLNPPSESGGPSLDVEGFIRSAPVEVSFEIARLALTAEQLSLASAGDVIELGRVIGAPIQVRVGERLIGEGELVDVEGQLGVRLLWVGP